MHRIRTASEVMTNPAEIQYVPFVGEDRLAKPIDCTVLRGHTVADKLTRGMFL